MKILLPVDGSAYTKRMLAYLAEHRDWLAASPECTVMTVSAPLPNGLAALLDEQAIRARYDADAETVFKPIRSFLQMQGIEARFVHDVGNAGRVLAKLAEGGGFDLIVMGSHGHGALGTAVLGSVANTVLALCKVPVLIIR